jgi:site-specific DNA-cytosine methylase
VSHVDTTKAGIKELRHLSLCSGYGGIDLGLRRVLPACRTVAYVEIEAFAIWNLVQKMEKGYLDAAPVWTNLKTMPLAQLREVLGRESIISGGFPCQPFSVAGAKAGDEDPRHLFPYIVDAVRTIQPRWVFLENVEGIISSKLKSDNWADPAGTPVLLHVLRELERLGYRAEAGVFSASEVGLPHQRKRVFILAHSSSARSKTGLPGSDQGQERHTEELNDYRDRSAAPARPGQQQYPWEPPRVILGNSDTGRHLQQEGDQPEGRGWDSHTGSERAELGNSEDTGRRELVHESCETREAERGHFSGASDQAVKPRNFITQMDRSFNGATDWLDYAQLCSSVDNRTDELRLLGNGVVPATAAKAFTTLYERIING